MKNVRDSAWSVKQFVDWLLLSSNVYFVITHIHQGLSALGWNLSDLYIELKRLKYHVGFPNGINLNCPIFTQDKYGYISSVPGLCNPTMKIQLNDELFSIQDDDENEMISLYGRSIFE